MKSSSVNYEVKSFGKGVLLWTVVFFLAAGLSRAQEPNEKTSGKTSVSSPENVIESDIGMEQMQMDQPAGMDMEQKFTNFGKSANPPELRIKEDQIVTINHSLKKMIEENEKLRQKAQELDEQLKQLRGQSNIDQNRVNTISVERDAYKSQNEVMTGLTKRYSEDIENLQRKLAEKENQLAAQPPAAAADMTDETALASAPGPALLADSSAAAKTPETVGLGTIQVRKGDEPKNLPEHGGDILKMLDDVKQKSQKLMADEAKVHYNMGNMFFKRREYDRAKNEFESALRLAPKDPSTHFNLAFVNGEFLHDYKTAVTHYREYLELNPDAEDAPLVREKIIESELYLRSQISSDLEQQVDTEKDRSYR